MCLGLKSVRQEHKKIFEKLYNKNKEIKITKKLKYFAFIDENFDKNVKSPKFQLHD